MDKQNHIVENTPAVNVGEKQRGIYAIAVAVHGRRKNLLSNELEWRINIKVVTEKGEELIDQPLNDFPLQGLPTELAINVGSQEERQVIKDWHYFEVKVYLKRKEEVPYVEP